MKQTSDQEVSASGPSKAAATFCASSARSVSCSDLLLTNLSEVLLLDVSAASTGLALSIANQ